MSRYWAFEWRAVFLQGLWAKSGCRASFGESGLWIESVDFFYTFRPLQSRWNFFLH